MIMIPTSKKYHEPRRNSTGNSSAYPKGVGKMVGWCFVGGAERTSLGRQ